MKIKTIVAAGLLAVLGTGTVAEAQPFPPGHAYGLRDHRDHDRRDWRRDRDHRYEGRRWGHGDRRWDRHRPRCHTEWRHHRRIRVCR